MINASPTAASAAATPIENSANITPVKASGFGPYLQNAIKFKFAAFSINSIPTSTRIAFRRVSAPANPTENSSAEISRHSVNPVISRASSPSSQSSQHPPAPPSVADQSP